MYRKKDIVKEVFMSELKEIVVQVTTDYLNVRYKKKWYGYNV